MSSPDRSGILDVLGLQLHRVGVEEVHGFIQKTIRENGKACVLNLNIHCVSLAVKNPWLKDFINRAGLVFCDGEGVRLGLKLLGQTPPPKIPFTRWIWQLGKFCEGKGIGKDSRDTVLARKTLED